MNPKFLSKYLIIVVALVILTSSLILPSSALAAGAAVVSVSAPSQSTTVGTQFTVNISVQPNNAIAGAQFDLSFNPNLVTVNSVTEGNLLKQGGASTYFMAGQINNTAGTITGVADVINTPGQTVSATGILAAITMTAKTTAGTCSLNLSNVIVGDINGQAISSTTSNGQVVITTNHAPVLSSIGNKTVNENQTLSFIISSTDVDGNTLTYSASNLPSGANFNASTRTFSWTPSYTQAGSYTGVHFQVSDGSLTASEDITIIVTNINRTPVLTAIGNKTTNEGQTLTFTITGSDPDGDALTYSVSNLPAGASFNAATHTFTWTPNYAQAGTYSNIRFQVSDGTLTASEAITITVAQPYADWDTNHDNAVNVLDMVLLGQHWGETGSIAWRQEDISVDGTVNVLDAILIGQHWTN
jgi:hypothetical protein